jgi:hypothetical protein
MFSRNSKPFGRTWEEWAASWWVWCFSQSNEESPVSDTTGKFCCKNQTDPNVWFLAGTFGDKVGRTCTLPAGKAILFPIVNDLISYAEYIQLKTENDLRAYAKDDLDQTTIYKVWVDDMELQNLRNCRIQSKIFNIVIPDGCMWKPTKAVTDGYWVLLKPLSSGRNHTIHFIGEKLRYDEVHDSKFRGNEPKFRVEVKYHLIVK